MKIAIVGVGNLGAALAQMLLAAGFCRDDMSLVARSSGASVAQCERLGLAPRSIEAVCGVDVAVISVKPQDAQAVCQQMRPLLSKETVVLSMMAGVSCATVADLCAHGAVARAMPNLGAIVGQSATVYCASAVCSDFQLECVERVIKACGKAYRVDRETLLDVATAVAGSGPAYLCWLGEQMERVAIDEGFSPADARAIVLQTFKGAVAYLDHEGESFSGMRIRVTSPNGTTAAALQVLSAAHSDDDFQTAVRAALSRSQELGGLCQDSQINT